MRFWIALAGIFLITTTSGCSILKRNRITTNNGEQRNDFDLPVILYPASNPLSNRLLILLSGDGGWLDFNDQLATAFSQKGFHVVGFNARSYFWEQRTPDQTAADIVLLINTYAKLYKTRRIYLSGYSFGADVIPFIYNRLPATLKKKVAALEMLSPFATTDFMVHTSDLLNISSDTKTYKVDQELSGIRIPVFCFYGADEDPKPLENIKKKNFIIRQVRGDHHYKDSAQEKIVNILRSLRLIKL